MSNEVNIRSERTRIARAASLVSGMTLVSRLLGLAREVVFAALLGAGYYSDAFRMAFRIPNLLRDMFAEGALSSAFVPTYTRILTQEGRPAAFQLANRVLTALALLLGAVVALGIAFADPLVGALAPGYEDVPGKAELTVLMTRVMMPFLPLVAFAAVAMGMLNAEERFGIPALSPAMFNAIAVGWGIGLWALGLPAYQVVLGWALGTLLGGLAQLLIQVPSLRGLGWRFRPDWAPGDPGLRRIVQLMGPATAGLAAVQVNLFVNGIFASHQEGAVSWLEYAFRLLYLPIGLFGVALGTIATAGLARRASEGDMDGLRTTLRESLSMLAYLTIPATAGLIALRVPVVRLIYERGIFTPADTEATAAALLLYSFGLMGYSGVKVLAPAFYALHRPRVPLVASLLAVATNVTVALLLFPRIGFQALALGTALASLVNASILAFAFQSRVGGLLGQGLARATGPMVGAAVVMGGAAWACSAGLEQAFGSGGLARNLIIGLVPVLVGVALYGLLTRWWRVGEAETLWALAQDRLGRSGTPNP